MISLKNIKCTLICNEINQNSMKYILAVKESLEELTVEVMKDDDFASRFLDIIDFIAIDKKHI